MPLYDNNPLKLPHRPIVTWAPDRAQHRGLPGRSSAAAMPDGHADARFGADAGGARSATRDAGPARRCSRSSPTCSCTPTVGTSLGNMMFLWVFGDDIEEALGHVRFLRLLSAVRRRRRRSPSSPAMPHSTGAADRRLGRDRRRRRRLSDAAALREGHGAGLRLIPVRLSAYWVLGALRRSCSSSNLESASRERGRLLGHVGGMAAGGAAVSRAAAARACGCSNACGAERGPVDGDAERPGAERTLTALGGRQ